MSILLDRAVLYSHFYYRPGEYRVSVTAPSAVGAAILRVRMLNEHRQMFEDRVRVVPNAGWYRIVKYLLLLPLALMAVLFKFIQHQEKRPSSASPALPQ